MQKKSRNCTFDFKINAKMQKKAENNISKKDAKKKQKCKKKQVECIYSV